MNEVITYFLPHIDRLGPELVECVWQTATMVAVSGTIAWFLGVAIGVLLVITRQGGLWQNSWIFLGLDKSIDIIRSIPFIILIVLLIPLSRFLVGTGSGVTGSFVALVFGTVPFFARQIESVLSDLDDGLIEASLAMGFFCATNHLRRLLKRIHPRHYPSHTHYLCELYRHNCDCRRNRCRRFGRLCDSLRLSNGLPRHDFGSRSSLFWL